MLKVGHDKDGHRFCRRIEGFGANLRGRTKTIRKTTQETDEAFMPVIKNTCYEKKIRI